MTNIVRMLSVVKEFQGFLTIVDKLTNDMRVELSKDSLTFTGISSDQVCLFQYVIKPNMCVEFDVTKPKNYNISPYNFLDGCKESLQKCDELEMKFSKEIKLSENIFLFNRDMDNLEKSMDFNKFKTDISATMNSEELERIVKICDKISSVVKIRADTNKNSLIVESHESSPFQASITSQGAFNVDSVGEKKKAVARFSVEYLKIIVAARKISDSVILRLETDYPIILEYGMLKFVLAPRVDAD